MGIEIERKFLVTGDFPKSGDRYRIKQGYINPDLGTVHISDVYLIIRDKKENNLEVIYIGSDNAQSIKKHLDTDIFGNLTFKDKSVARIRVRDSEGFVTIKGKACVEGTPEYEYKIPDNIAEYLLGVLSDGYISKTRHLINYKGKVWEVDEFSNPKGLVIAEIELADINEPIEIPEWVGTEVTGDHRYSNSNIIKKILEDRKNAKVGVCPVTKEFCPLHDVGSGNRHWCDDKGDPSEYEVCPIPNKAMKKSQEKI